MGYKGDALAPESVRFAVLGTVRVWRAGTELRLGGPQQTALLALLLMRAGQPVAVDEMVEVLWGRRPPDSAANVIRRHVGALRRLLEPGLPARAGGGWIVRGTGGYRLVTDGDSLDLLRFRELRDEARRAATGGDPAGAVHLLTRALSLWQGPVAAGLPEQVRAHEAFTAPARERVEAVKEAADAALRTGLPGAVLGELRETAADHPLDEPLLARLVHVLAATGHPSEALRTYDTTVSRLADELGIDPGPELRHARRTMLVDADREEPRRTREDVGGAFSERGSAFSSPGTDGPEAIRLPTPAQLPPDLATFTGRRVELDEALTPLVGDAWAESAADGPADGTANGSVDGTANGPVTGTVVIGAIGGMAGIGKTTLAVHWAHQVAHRFPDGQLYVNLRGYDPSGAVMSPGEAVRGFLDTLGVPPERVPHGLDAQVALYRSLLAGQRFLVLLDNARDTDHVRPLLPGTPGCLALVTSRDQLSGLVAAHGARALTLHPLDTDEARDFLTRRLGASRVAAEPEAVAEIAALCAGLPLALACVAARAVTHPRFALSAIAAELREAHGSLDAFARADASADVGAVFSWSSRALSPGAARLFPLLSLHPGPDFSVTATAALAGLPVRQVRRQLAELAHGHLIGERVPGRYAFHDLLRAHAGELVHDRHPETERRAAAERLYTHHLHTAHAAGLLLAPHADLVPLPPTPTGVAVVPLADDREALAWLTAEYPVLLAVIDTAAHSGHDRLACLLAWAMEPYFDRRGHWHDWATAQRTALNAALRLSDSAMEAHGLRGLARAEGRLGLHDSARARLHRALDLFTGLGDDVGRAQTHRSLGWEHEQQGDLPGALRHNQRALELFRAAGHRAAQASVLNSVGWYHALLGEYEQALGHCLDALDTLREIGDRYGQAATWHSVAHAYHHLGRHPQSLIGYRNALTLYQDLGVPYLEATTLTGIGDTHRATGDHAAARTAWLRALTLLVGLGHPDAAEVRTRLQARDERRGLA
ncbi:BTAD domain-containing putative transcriptional regulator [Streptomyces sp. NPDC046862]|uniref:AfsR/SARP family transcriptional regulator n=1 Tax=Streptomyces sp. NPDC046862 TaxID=3154603 RepID=UPI003452C1EF